MTEQIHDVLGARALIAHDWLQGMHGAERTVLAMQGVFRDGADIATFMADREAVSAELVERIVRQPSITRRRSFGQRGHEGTAWRYLLPAMGPWFRRVDTSGYDVVVSSTHACAVCARATGGALHAAYVYTPIRYVWGEAQDARVRGAAAVAMELAKAPMRRQDLRAAQRPDVVVAISTAVAERVERIWGRTSEVVHPPVAVDEFEGVSLDAERDPAHFLWVHRFVGYKRPLEVAAAFAELHDLRLTMVGLGPLADEVRASAPPNVTVHGWMPREELVGLFGTASGFIHVGEEDFGISMVEALAAGVPVLCASTGGAVDIVRPGVDGVVASGTGPREIADGVRELAAGDWRPAALRDRARDFSEAAFVSRMRAVLRAHGAS